MSSKRKAPSSQRPAEVDKKSKIESLKRRHVSGESSKSGGSSRSSNHYDSDTSSNDSFYQFSDYYQPEKRKRFEDKLLETVVGGENGKEYRFYRETPEKRGLDKLRSRGQQKKAKKCIERLTDNYNCLGEGSQHTIIQRDEEGFRVDYQKSYAGKKATGKKFAVLAVQKESDMYASAHIETDVEFGHINVQKALTHSLDETNKADADPKGHRVRLIRVEKEANDPTSPARSLSTVEEEDHSDRPTLK